MIRACDAIYRFLASLKLAVLSLGALAFTLGYATFFEKWYGTAAVQEWIYKTLVLDLAGVSRRQHPLRGLDSLPLETSADRIRDHPRLVARAAGGLVVGGPVVRRRPVRRT